jgi:hypothetical protein
MRQSAAVASVCHKKLDVMERETVGMALMNLAAVSILGSCLLVFKYKFRHGGMFLYVH